MIRQYKNRLEQLEKLSSSKNSVALLLKLTRENIFIEKVNAVLFLKGAKEALTMLKNGDPAIIRSPRIAAATKNIMLIREMDLYIRRVKNCQSVDELVEKIKDFKIQVAGNPFRAEFLELLPLMEKKLEVIKRLEKKKLLASLEVDALDNLLLGNYDLCSLILSQMALKVDLRMMLRWNSL